MAALGLQDGRIVGFNHAAADRLGHPPQALLAGLELRTCVAPADRPVLSSALQRSAGYPVVVTLQLLRCNGDSAVTELTLIGGWGGNPQLILALAANPAETPGALGHDWRFLRHVIDASTAMIFVKDREGRFLLANKALAGVYDLTVAEVEGRLNAELHSNAEETEAFLRDDREVMDSGRSKLIVAEPVTYSDGSVHWYSTVKTPLLLDDMHCDHVLGIATNIDELIKIEQELLRLQSSLERRVEARTQELNAKESQLREALALNQSILMSSTAGILAYRGDGQCVLANPAAAALVGGSQAQLLAQNFHRIGSWRQSGLYDAACRALQTDTPIVLEVRFVSTFGSALWITAQFARFTIQGEPHLMLVIHDVTATRQATQALAERELAFRNLADNVPDNVVRYDLEGRAIFVNRKLESTLGRPADQLVGKTLEEWGDREVIERYGELLATVIGVGASGAAATFEQQVPGPDGDVRYHLIRIVPEPGPDGRPQSVLAVGRDITDEKIAEEKLRLAASVFHNTAEGVLITDAEGTILSVNPAFCAITGYSEGEAVGRTPRILRSDHQGPEFYLAMWNALLNEGHWEGEIWNRRRNGEAYLEWLTINRIDDQSGKPVRYVSVFHDITEMRNKDEHIRHLAFHDALTGLPNRSLMQDRLQHAMNRCSREQRRLSVTFIDLDRFKSINDSLGHDVGDLLLQVVAERLRGRLRSMDTVARLGGDEFVVLVEDLQAVGDSACLAQDLIAEIARPIILREHRIEIGASMGMAFFPEDGDDPLELMKRADMAMYAAKAAGRNTYRFFQQEMLDLTSARLSLEIELRHAIANGELALHYQPKVDLASGRDCGVEALLRWNHPQRGLVPPGDFIPLAEESGLIVDIGDWVLSAACQQMAAWRAAGRSINVAVNISMRQLGEGDLVERIAKLTERHGLKPADLSLELTESVVMADPESIAGLFARLREAGVTVAVDDFGTGYSSLAYLRRLPIDVLKIDRSFVMDADHDEEDAQIVKTIVALGQALKLTVVAEGIESPGQAELLRAMGCDQAQGYLFSRPVPAEELVQWLDRTAGR